MRIVTLLIACVVFAALLVVDTGALLGLAFSWVLRGPTYRWALLSACFAIVVLYVWSRKRWRTPARGRAGRARSPRRPKARRPQESTRPRRQRKSIMTNGRR